ncbi:MAG: DnaA N-terminal domain-containing protein [Anaerolineales bacterium]
MVSDTKQHNSPETTAAAETLWSSTLLQLEQELPRATFDTWIRDLIPISFQDSILTLGAGNAYARDWVQERVSQTIRRVLETVSGAEITISIVVYDDHDDTSDSMDIELPEDDPHQDSSADPDLLTNDHDLDTIDDDVELTPEYLSLYDEIVRPDRVIVFPSYFLRWIPYLGVDLAWLPIGFRQVAFLRGLKFNPGDTFQASGREIARWSGMSLRTFRRRVNDPMLRWFIKPIKAENKDSWVIGDDDRPHREPSRWGVVMSMPLTPDDRDSLHDWLSNHIQIASSPSRLLELAIQTPLEELLPTPESIIPPEIADNPVSVQFVVAEFMKQHYPDAPSAIEDLSDALAHLIVGHPIVITHYFVRKWLPVLGSGPGWLITLMRNHVSGQFGPVYEAEFSSGYEDLSRLLGVSPVSLSRWISGKSMKTKFLPEFINEISSSKQSDQTVSRTYKVSLIDPITPDDQAMALSKGKTNQGAEQIGTHRSRGLAQFGTLREEADAHFDTNRDVRHVDFDTHRSRGDKQTGTYSEEGDVHFDTSKNKGDEQIDTEEQGGHEQIGTGYISGGLKDSLKRDNVLTSSINSSAKISNRAGGWNFRQLLVNAKVYPSVARQISNADPAAFVSWLLYAASSRGAKIIEPVGHTVERLREYPTQGAGGAYDNLARLGPDQLGDLLHRELSYYDASWGNTDWKDAMTDADHARLRLIAEIIDVDSDVVTPQPDFDKSE